MKLGTRILLFVIAVIFTSSIIACGGFSTFVSRMAMREVNKALKAIPDCEASCGEVQMGLIAGSTKLKNLRLRYRSDSTDRCPGSDIRIDQIELTHTLFSLMRFHEIRLLTLTVSRPKIEIWMDETHPELSFPTFTIDTALFNPKDMPKVTVLLQSLRIRNASFALHSVCSKLDVEAEHCSLTLHRLRFDSVFSCRDTSYVLSVGPVKVQLPDGRSHLTTQQIEIGPLAHDLLADKQVIIKALKIREPHLDLRIDETRPAPDLCFTLPLKRAELQHLLVENASLALRSTRTHLNVKADSCSLALHHIAMDPTFHLCDSVYDLYVGRANILFPDSMMHLSTCHIRHRNAGEIQIGRTRIGHTMPKKQLADIVEEPVTWIDMHLERIDIAPLNPFHMAKSQDFTISHIDATVGFMDIFRDERYKPRRMYGMPQPVLMALPVTFDVLRTDAQLKKIHVAFAATSSAIGHLDMEHIHASVDHITNRRGETIHLSGYCPFGTGQAQAAFDLMMNDSCQFGMHIHATGINTSVMNPFIRPLVGMTSDCMIDTLDTHYLGTDKVANGTYRMLYHGFSMEVHKEDDIPYRIITKHAKTFNNLANSLIPKSNPAARKHAKPLGYQVTWTRNAKRPTELYLFGPIIDGIKKTFLPGLYVHMRTKDNQFEEIN